MVKRFRADTADTPAKPPKRKRGRPAGATNKQTQLSIRQALLNGPLSHMNLLAWGQTGVMDVPEKEYYTIRKPRVETDPETGERRIVDDYEVRVKAKRDQNGNIVYVTVPVPMELRIEAAAKSAKFFASEVTNEKEGRSEEELRLLYQRKGIETLDLIATPLLLESGNLNGNMKSVN